MSIKIKRPGTSIWVDLTPKDGKPLGARHSAKGYVIDSEGNEVFDTLVYESSDNKRYELRIDRDKTTNLKGEYLVKVLLSSREGYGEYIYYQRYKFFDS